MTKTFGRRVAAAVAGVALAGSGLAVYGAADLSAAQTPTPTPSASPEPTSSPTPSGDPTTSPDPSITKAQTRNQTPSPSTSSSPSAAPDFDLGRAQFEPPSVENRKGERVQVTIPVTVYQQLRSAITLNVGEEDGLTCTPKDQQIAQSTKPGSESFVLDCVLNRQLADKSDEVRSYFTLSYNGVTTAADDFYIFVNSEGVADNAAEADRSQVQVKSGSFDPARAVVKSGGKFTFTKEIVVSEAPLTDDLTMKLSNYKNLKCEPTEDTLKAGTKPGTYEFVFNCTFQADGQKAEAQYIITGGDLGGKGEKGAFGYGDITGPDSDTKGKAPRSSDGGLADTGAPALGVVLVGGLAAATAGGLMLRRRMK